MPVSHAFSFPLQTKIKIMKGGSGFITPWSWPIRTKLTIGLELHMSRLAWCIWIKTKCFNLYGMICINDYISLENFYVVISHLYRKQFFSTNFCNKWERLLKNTVIFVTLSQYSPIVEFHYNKVTRMTASLLFEGKDNQGGGNLVQWGIFFTATKTLLQVLHRGGFLTREAL